MLRSELAARIAVSSDVVVECFDLTKLSVAAVSKALENSGYLDNALRGARFVTAEMPRGFLYEIAYCDLETGNLTAGSVYVFISNNGRVCAEYVQQAA